MPKIKVVGFIADLDQRVNPKKPKKQIAIISYCEQCGKVKHTSECGCEISNEQW